MDLLDFEPIAALAPKRLLEVASFGFIVVLAVSSDARDFLVDQAIRHAQHEIQPLIDQILTDAAGAD